MDKQVVDSTLPVRNHRMDLFVALALHNTFASVKKQRPDLLKHPEAYAAIEKQHLGDALNKRFNAAFSDAQVETKRAYVYDLLALLARAPVDQTAKQKLSELPFKKEEWQVFKDLLKARNERSSYDHNNGTRNAEPSLASAASSWNAGEQSEHGSSDSIRMHSNDASDDQNGIKRKRLSANDDSTPAALSGSSAASSSPTSTGARDQKSPLALRDVLSVDKDDKFVELAPSGSGNGEVEARAVATSFVMRSLFRLIAEQKEELTAMRTLLQAQMQYNNELKQIMAASFRITTDNLGHLQSESVELKGLVYGLANKIDEFVTWMQAEQQQQRYIIQQQQQQPQAHLHPQQQQGRYDSSAADFTADASPPLTSSSLTAASPTSRPPAVQGSFAASPGQMQSLSSRPTASRSRPLHQPIPAFRRPPEQAREVLEASASLQTIGEYPDDDFLNSI